MSLPDNRENDKFDLLRAKRDGLIKFEYKESGNYTEEIMKTINYIISLSSQPFDQNSDSLSNFEAF